MDHTHPLGLADILYSMAGELVHVHRSNWAVNIGDFVAGCEEGVIAHEIHELAS